MLISVIVPIFNPGHLLERCLDSLLTQSHKDVEIILVNDSSTDSSKELCAQYTQSAPKKITYIELPVNTGASHARNVGLHYATGSLICFIDADDFVSQDFFAEFVAEYKRKPYDFCFCGFSRLNVETGEHPLLKGDNAFPGRHITAIRWAYCFTFCKIYHCAAMYRRSYLLEHGLGYNENHVHAEDNELLTKILFNTNRVTYIPKILYTHVLHSGSLSKQLPDEKVFTAYSALCLASKSIPGFGWRCLYKAVKIPRIHNHILGLFASADTNLPYWYCARQRILCALLWNFLLADKNRSKKALRYFFHQNKIK